MSKKYKTTTIEWWDAARSTADWLEAHELPAPVYMKTTGFVVKKTKQYIVVCGTVTGDKGFGECIAIPLPWIVK
jgi:hypothetical protein